MERKKIKEIEDYVKKNVSKKRYEHSRRVAETAEKLCAIYGFDTDKGYLAGISHDICKEIPADKMIELAKKDGEEVTPLETEKPSLLHGRAAAVFLKEKFGIEDKDVLEAVGSHVFGRKNLCGLGKIIFVADKIEPDRPQSTTEYRKRLMALPLDEITYSVIDENIKFHESLNKIVAPASYALRDELKSLVEQSLSGGNGEKNSNDIDQTERRIASGI